MARTSSIACRRPFRLTNGEIRVSLGSYAVSPNLSTKVLDIVQFGGLSFIVSIKTDSSSCVGLPRVEQRPASIQANTGNSTVKLCGRSQGWSASFDLYLRTGTQP